ncbi:response regulator transcription factor [Kineosporia sp. J2-2]|uniref:Response regulator transcription factor n=1 Tax=Kineosporia corallincola TaxID=2835133 RepID=A0ABS5TNF9_9ACTN|nr:response regulator transcription factor [Kineosporia corallincola]MBT0772636.1 response regulator transcription factor [Kineosporia corallincola]
MRPVSVLVVDDNAGVRSGLCDLLGTCPDLHVVGEAWDGERAVELTRSLQPDVVLLDVRMPRRDGVSAAAEISRTSRVLMMTFTEDHEVIRNAVAAGASGYLVHGAFEPEDLVNSVLAVARGSGVFSVGALAALRQVPEPAPQPLPRPDFGLSERQAEILELIAEGLSNGEIAERCFLSEKTVKNHINRIFATLGVRTRSEAIARWFRAGRAG